MTATDNIGGMFFFSSKKRKKNDEVLDEENDMSNLLCRFVLDGLGEKVGESVAIDGDIIVIKAGGKYLGVPLKTMGKKEKTLRGNL